MIKAVFFDLDNTLYDENYYFMSIFDLFCTRHNLNFQRFINCFDDNFRISSKDIFKDILLKNNFYTDDRQNELFDLYQRIDSNIQLYPDAIKVLNLLCKKKIKIGIITNGVVAAQKNKIRLLNLDSFNITIFYAREKGKQYEKPNPQIYFYAAEEFNLKTESSLFVGDNPHTDIQGAINANMQALWYINGYAAQNNYHFEKKIYKLYDVITFIESGIQ